jgi:hypothetical protein
MDMTSTRNTSLKKDNGIDMTSTGDTSPPRRSKRDNGMDMTSTGELIERGKRTSHTLVVLSERGEKAQFDIYFPLRYEIKYKIIFC